MMTSYKSNPNTITCMCHGTWTGIWQNESHTLKKSNLTRECIPGFPFPLANPDLFSFPYSWEWSSPNLTQNGKSWHPV